MSSDFKVSTKEAKTAAENGLYELDKAINLLSPLIIKTETIEEQFIVYRLIELVSNALDPSSSNETQSIYNSFQKSLFMLKDEYKTTVEAQQEIVEAVS